MSAYGTYDSEYGVADEGAPFSNFENAFSEKAVRMGFIRKVYGILMVQLAITLGFIALFLYVPAVKKFTSTHIELFWIALVLMFILMIILVCCDKVRRTSPTNIFILMAFTVLESFLLGFAAGGYDSDEVVMAVGICAVVSLGLTIFAFQTKWDFTLCGGFLFVSVLILILFGFICIFIPGRVVSLVYASLGALIFSLYLVYDTQLMIGGSHRYSISPEEYIFAALNLYLDIINLFLFILQIISSAKD
ncbi:protein lifeguard 1-like [Limulus polyphemus]|uniref:Protein lifeguard 1-like n=1 Tax=Limulus polyphemus TaxID=6850 RepID=A0ABM1BQY4_LIMPO|nr:protein lifeguard 1-like [Limulus polyphemus]XP_022255254.1 protein lifeguard 1-like [Limulus polyphemus]XP_022255255.1 protein lifeguard 1-like [Limulus polyphemus]